MLADLTTTQLDDWEEFYNRVGFGPDRYDVGFAQIAHLIYSANFKHKTKLTDWMPYYDANTEYSETDINAAYQAYLEAKAKQQEAK